MAMKSRWWWMPGDKDKTSNMYWTQNKSKKAFEKLRRVNDIDDSPKRDLETSMSSEDTAAPNVSSSSGSLMLKDKKLSLTQKGPFSSKAENLTTPKKGQSAVRKLKSLSRTSEKFSVKR